MISSAEARHKYLAAVASRRLNVDVNDSLCSITASISGDDSGNESDNVDSDLIASVLHTTPPCCSTTSNDMPDKLVQYQQPDDKATNINFNDKHDEDGQGFGSSPIGVDSPSVFSFFHPETSPSHSPCSKSNRSIGHPQTSVPLNDLAEDNVEPPVTKETYDKEQECVNEAVNSSSPTSPPTSLPNSSPTIIDACNDAKEEKSNERSFEDGAASVSFNDYNNDSFSGTKSSNIAAIPHHNNEAKYEEGATALFNLIEASKWEETILRLKEKPQEAKIWVTNSGAEGAIFICSVWRRLPLHEVSFTGG